MRNKLLEPPALRRRREFVPPARQTRSALDEGLSRVHVRREGLDEAEHLGAVLQERDDAVLDEALQIARRNTSPWTGAGPPLGDEGAADVVAIASPVPVGVRRRQP